ncbi:MAG: hypothetical protein KAH05_04780, partial [Clostridiales bacterium]|nr:hypothetical protein [Clostridiales bacterium]
MLKKIFERQNVIGIIIIVVVAVLITRLANLTIINGEYYSEKAINNRIKKISEVAKRGEIFDRNGELLAGNIPAFTIQFMGDGLNDETFNQVAIKAIDLLDSNGENHIELPIVYNGGNIEYSYDLDILEWLSSNGYNGYVSASTVFNNIRIREQISDELNDYEAQNFMLLKGIKLPISVKTMKYINEMHKENFLKSYGLDINTSAKEALEYLR